MEQEKREYIQKMKQKLAQQQIGDIVASWLFRTQNINWQDWIPKDIVFVVICIFHYR